MALRTFTYSGGKWTGQVTFCGVSLDVEVRCVDGSWSVKVGGQEADYGIDGITNIGGTDYVEFWVWILSLAALGINPANCNPPGGSASGEFVFYLPYDGTISCGGD